MAYKEKTCPKCQTKHNKRGEYCSRSCGNQKKHTEETKQKIADAQRAYLTSGTDEAEVAKHNFISKRNNAEPDPIAPITKKPIESNQFVQDGDLWTEV
jgi:predicted amidophosphoribosyltransferase